MACVAGLGLCIMIWFSDRISYSVRWLMPEKVEE